jgi:hypothetical protein
MQRPSPFHDWLAPVSVQTDHGKAGFRRVGHNRVVLEVAVEAPPLQARASGLTEGAVYDTVEALREADVRRMKQTLDKLAEQLKTQLSDDGSRAALDLHQTWHEERDWSVAGDAVSIAGSATHSRTDLQGVEGVSDVNLAQATIAAMIHAREVGIRSVYEQVLLAVTTRDGPTSSGTTGGEGPCIDHR